MLRIQVLGKGLIPRGLGLAPRTEPFPADLNLIGTILQTPGLRVNYLTPQGQMAPLTAKNLKKVWDSERARILKEATEAALKERAKTTVNKPAPAPTPAATAPTTPPVKQEEPKKEVPAQVAPPAVSTQPEKKEENPKPAVQTTAPVQEVKKDETPAPTPAAAAPTTPPVKQEEPKKTEEAAKTNTTGQTSGGIKPVHAHEKKDDKK